MKITENNKLIAEFMGAITVGKSMMFPAEASFPKKEFIESLEYDTSWDWLMPVVEKIESIDEYEVVMYDVVGCEIHDRRKGNTIINIHSQDTKINAVYKAVIEFIKWYNEQK